MKKSEATYQYLEEKHGNGMFFYTSCCGNRMYSVDSNPMKYHGRLCPRCFWHNVSVTLYLRGTPDGIRVFESEEYMTEYRPLTPDFRQDINNGIDKRITELKKCEPNALVSVQIEALSMYKRLINGLPDGYPMPLAAESEDKE